MGSVLSFKHKGNFEKTSKYLVKAAKLRILPILEKYGRKGVSDLEKATPVLTGETKSSWSYKVTETRKGYSLAFYNSVDAGGVPLVILLQYGHGTGTGGYIPGRDFINPAIVPIMDSLSEELWKEVTRL